MRSTRAWSCFVFLGAALLGAGAFADEEWKAPESAAKKKNPIPVNDTTMAKAKAVYQKECLSCHGAKGKGDGPAAEALEKKPRNLSVSAKGQSDGSIFWKVSEGRKPMPTFSKTMTVDDRWTVIYYVRTLAGEKPGADSAGDTDTKAAPPQFAAPDSYRTAISTLVQSYLAVEAALAKEDATGAQGGAAAVADAVGKLPKADGEGLADGAKSAWGPARTAVEKAAESLKAAKDLAGSRGAFKDLSTALIDMVTKFGHAESGPLSQLSSDAGTWLQAGDGTSPFEKGKSGKVVKTLSAKIGG
jgi:mono/diheme cytochrome c family protein